MFLIRKIFREKWVDFTEFFCKFLLWGQWKTNNLLSLNEYFVKSFCIISEKVDFTKVCKELHGYIKLPQFPLWSFSRNFKQSIVWVRYIHGKRMCNYIDFFCFHLILIFEGQNLNFRASFTPKKAHFGVSKHRNSPGLNTGIRYWSQYRFSVSVSVFGSPTFEFLHMDVKIREPFLIYCRNAHELRICKQFCKISTLRPKCKFLLYLQIAHISTYVLVAKSLPCFFCYIPNIEHIYLAIESINYALRNYC